MKTLIVERIEEQTSIEAVWSEMTRYLKTVGLPFAIYITVSKTFSDPLVLTNFTAPYETAPPENDPFLRHACASYEITKTGSAYVDDYDYLPEEAKAFIRTAGEAGWRTGFGIPVKLQGSERFGGFNLGCRMGREEFELRFEPKAEHLRFICLIAHRRIEELRTPELAARTSEFRDLLVAPSAGALARLSPREREVLYLVTRGVSRKECARLCGISPHTVAEYTKSAYRKLGVSNRMEAAQKVLQPN